MILIYLNKRVEMIEYNGKQYARVTEILSGLSDFSHIPAAVLKNKQDIGTTVHEAIHDDVTGEFPILSEKEVGYFDSYKLWEKHTTPRFIQTETRYYNDEKMISGQIDGLVNLYGKDRAILIDFKTSVTESPTWPFQAHLYRFLITSTGIIIDDHMHFIKLDKNGGMPKVYTYSYDPNLMAACMDAIDRFWVREKKDSQNSHELIS
jgi:hypothetical protein